jgi:molybdopterin molybdotransferase
MDGFALRAPDATAGATLKIIGTAPAGHPFPGAIGPGQAVRCFTGSVVPAGATTVLIQENATYDATTLTVNAPPGPAKYIRPAGQDFRLGDLLLPRGTRLTAQKIGLAAAANHPCLTVHRRPRIAILSTGDEIALPGEPLPEGGIISSNAHMLAALITQAGGAPSLLPIAPDNLDSLSAAAAAAQGADLLVTTGGASVGDHDLLRQTPSLSLDFWRIAMRPGKPLLFGHIQNLPVLGLPGNPVSAFVCALLFLNPALERLQSLPGDPPALEPATLATVLKPNDQREDYLRATLAPGDLVTPFLTQDSGMLRTLASANCLIRRPPFDPARNPGDPIQIIRLT